MRTRVSLTALGILASALVMGGAAHAVDCRSPRAAVEVEVCRDVVLSGLDGEMQQAYAAAFARADEKGRRALQQQQKIWERDRNGCGNQLGCLRAIYPQRIDELARFR